MSDRSSIEWTDATWNPVRGCVKISPGCKHCYAEAFAERFRGVKDHPYEQGFDPMLVPDKLADPFEWNGPRLVFVNSMSDLFQDAVPEDYIKRVVDVMLAADWHTYQVLTKRADRMHTMLKGPLSYAAKAKNIWWGVSVEDRKYGVPRIDELRKAPGRVRFLSVEPLLEDLGRISLRGIHWVIVGGESGRRARPMPKEWVRSLRDQCEQAEIPFFFKQWGGVNKKAAGRVLDGKTYDDMPARHVKSVPDRQARRAIAESLSLPTSATLVEIRRASRRAVLVRADL